MPETTPPERPARPDRAHPPRRHRRRRLRVAARQGVARDDRPTSRPRTPAPRRAPRTWPTCARQIFDEIKARTQETDLSVPYPDRATGGTTAARFEGKQYGASCRVPGRAARTTGPRRSLRAPTPRVARASRCCSTPTSWPRATTSSRSAASSVSPDGHLLAYQHRHRRRRALPAAGQGPAHRRAAARRDPRHARRRDLGPRRHAPLLHDRRRRLAPRQGVAARLGTARRRRRAGPPRDRRAVLGRRRAAPAATASW